MNPLLQCKPTPLPPFYRWCACLFKNEEQEATITRQQKQIEALTARLKKVSAQLEVRRPAPQLAESN